MKKEEILSCLVDSIKDCSSVVLKSPRAARIRRTYIEPLSCGSYVVFKDFTVRFTDSEYNTKEPLGKIIAQINSDDFYLDSLESAKAADETIHQYCELNEVKCQVLYEAGCLHFKKISALVPDCRVSISFPYRYIVNYSDDISVLLTSIIEKETAKANNAIMEEFWKTIALKYTWVEKLMWMFPESWDVHWQYNKYSKSIDIFMGGQYLYVIPIRNDFMFYAVPNEYSKVMERINSLEKIQTKVSEYARKLALDGRFDCQSYAWLDSVRVIVTAKMFYEKKDRPIAEFVVTKENFDEIDTMFSSAIQELLSQSQHYGTIVVGGDVNAESE